MIIAIQSQGNINAGGNETICEGDTVSLNGTVQNATNPVWTTNRNGTFTPNANALNATYTPGTEDLTFGDFTLTLTADQTNPCAGTVSNTKVVTITPQASVTLNPNIATICATENTYTFQAADVVVENSTALNWTTSGDGTFSGPDTSPTYTPGVNDKNNAGSIVGGKPAIFGLFVFVTVDVVSPGFPNPLNATD